MKEYIEDGGVPPKLAQELAAIGRNDAGERILGQLNPMTKELHLYKGSNLATLVEELIHYKQAKNLGIWGKGKFDATRIPGLEAQVDDFLKQYGFVPAPKGLPGRWPY